MEISRNTDSMIEQNNLKGSPRKQKRGCGDFQPTYLRGVQLM